jgi:hypothetical protein
LVCVAALCSREMVCRPGFMVGRTAFQWIFECCSTAPATLRQFPGLDGLGIGRMGLLSAGRCAPDVTGNGFRASGSRFPRRGACSMQVETLSGTPPTLVRVKRSALVD